MLRLNSVALLSASSLIAITSANDATNLCDATAYDALDFVADFGCSDQFLITNVQYTGSCLASGNIAFNDGTNYISETLFNGEDEILVLTTGSLSTAADSVNNFDGSSQANYVSGDSDLTNLLGGTSYTNDASIIEFDIVSTTGNDVLACWEYVFASEEYNEYVGSSFNDIFAFFVDGINVAVINDVDVSINSVNADSSLSGYYVNNDISDGYGNLATEYDGMTVLLSTIPFTIHSDYSIHIKIAIADTADYILDSAVFLRSGSFVVIDDIADPWDTPCDNDDCDCPNDINCQVCHETDPYSGCTQCTDGYFKLDWNYECANCNDIFGNNCLFCQDFHGCGQCAQGYIRTLDTNSGAYYCREQPISGNPCVDISDCDTTEQFWGICQCDDVPCDCNEYQDPYCAVCQPQGQCTQCQDGYFKLGASYPCASCNSLFGDDCIFCNDYIGCGQCQNGNRVQGDGGIWYCA